MYVFLGVIQYFSSLLAAIFYSMHLISGALKEASVDMGLPPV